MTKYNLIKIVIKKKIKIKIMKYGIKNKNKN